MSRRIIFAALAASAALIATQAIADRECFEDSCRVPEAAEPPAAAAKTEEPEAQAAQARAQVREQAEPRPPASQAAAQPGEVPEPVPPGVTVTVISEPAKPVVPPAAEARAESKLAPASVLPKVAAEAAPPKVVAEPAPRQTPPQASTRAEEARVRREPVRVPPSQAETRTPAAAPAPVAAAAPAPAVRAVDVVVPAYVRPEGTPQQAYVPPAAPTPPAGYVVRERPSVATAAVIEVPGQIQTGDGLVTVYPNLRPDPAWKLCQIDSRDLGRRSYRCTAYSYHPYGEGGYRPYGVYRNYPTAPGYVVAPNAKVISIDTND